MRSAFFWCLALLACSGCSLARGFIPPPDDGGRARDGGPRADGGPVDVDSGVRVDGGHACSAADEQCNGDTALLCESGMLVAHPCGTVGCTTTPSPHCDTFCT